MIRKKDLMEAINELTTQVYYQCQLVRELQKEVEALKGGKKAPLLEKKRLQKAVKEVTKDAPKRGRGRPRKNA